MKLKLSEGKSPFYIKEQTVSTMMDDVCFALLVLLILPVVYYGPRPLLTALFTCSACVLAMVLFRLVHRRVISLAERSLFVTGLTVTLLLPADVPYWAAAVAGFFAIFVVKEPFGSTGNNLFNPAAAGVAFISVLWPHTVDSFPTLGQLPIWGELTRVPVQTPALSLSQGLKPSLAWEELLWGKYPGPVGATAALIILGCGLYLFFRHTARWEITAGFLLSAAVVGALFPRFLGGSLSSAAYELLSGSLLFGAVFMMTDPVTSPKIPRARFLYGITGGLFTMLMRHMGAVLEPLCFAVLLSNACAPVYDMFVLRIRTKGGAFRGKSFRS